MAYDHEYHSGAAGMSLNPGIHGRVETEIKDGSAALGRVNVEISGITLFRAHKLSSSIGVDKRETQDRMEKGVVRFVRWDNCGKESERLKGIFGGYERLNDLYPAQQRLLAREVEKFNQTKCREGIPELEGNLSWTELLAKMAKPEVLEKLRGRNIPVFEIQTQRKPSTTGEVRIAEMTGVYDSNPKVDDQRIGARVKGLQLAWETSFKMGKYVQFDFCGGGYAGMVFGPTKVGESKTVASGDFGGHACGGLTIGKVGRIGYEQGLGASVSADTDRAFSEQSALLTNSEAVSIRNIAREKNPVYLYGKRENDSSFNVDHEKSVTVWTAGVGGSF
ncbi:hypothetical protein WDW37_01365 [Bdellovibrionota bacterium FG-1]